MGMSSILADVILQWLGYRMVKEDAMGVGRPSSTTMFAAGRREIMTMRYAVDVHGCQRIVGRRMM